MGIPGGGTDNRWGDFSATVVDPADDVTFWTLQEYAQIPDPVTGTSRWGTWWGKFPPSDVLPPTGLTATADNTIQVILRWTDLATNETGYVVERKVGAAGTFGVLTSPPLPPNSVTYTDNVGLVAGTTYFYRVGAVGSSGTSYSTEVSVTTPWIAPTLGRRRGRRMPFHHPIRRRAVVRHVALLRRDPPPPRVRPRAASFLPASGTNRYDPAPPLLIIGETRWRVR